MNWRSNKKLSVALLQANVNFQKERINHQKKKKSKKIKKNENPNIQKTKKKEIKKNPQKKSL
jgi:hypothetical protein